MPYKGMGFEYSKKYKIIFILNKDSNIKTYWKGKDNDGCKKSDCKWKNSIRN